MQQLSKTEKERGLRLKGENSLPTFNFQCLTIFHPFNAVTPTFCFMDLIHIPVVFYRQSNSSQKPSSRGQFLVTGLLPNRRSTHIAPQAKFQALILSSGESSCIRVVFVCSKMEFSEKARPPVSAASDPGGVCCDGMPYSNVSEIF